MKLLEEKMELLRWIINLNDEQVIRNLVNFKNEIFGVPFADAPACPISNNTPRSTRSPLSENDPRLSPDFLKFNVGNSGFLGQFEEALSLEEAKEQSIKKIQGWWRD